MRNYYTDPDEIDKEQDTLKVKDALSTKASVAESALFWKKTAQAVLSLVPIFVVPALGAVWYIKSQNVLGIYRIIPVFVALLCSWGMVFLLLRKLRIRSVSGNDTT